MKKLAIALALLLTVCAVLTSCKEKKKYDDYEEFQTNSTEKESLPPEPDAPGGVDDVLDVGADTADGWGPIIR